MILVDNINYLREKFPSVREQLMVVEKEEPKHFRIEDAKKGGKTLLYQKDGESIYFHSKYDPVKEAETILKEYSKVKDHNIIFYGTGLGYHIDLFIKENPDNDFYLFETIGELLEKYLSIHNLSKSDYKNLKSIALGLDNIAGEIKKFLNINRQKTIIIELPIHKQIFPEEYEKFSQLAIEIARAQRASLMTDYFFQERWIINSMKNFKEVLSTPNIIAEKKGKFKNTPAILVAAGPSLNEEIENIKYIQENKLAYIFSAGSAINTLLLNNILPDAITTYDPLEDNKNVFQKLKERKDIDIPLFFGSSVAYEVLCNYPGRMYHMITSQDKIASYYLGIDTNSEIEIISDAPSIAVVTLQLLDLLGFNPIILAGQNLAFVGQKRHADGVYGSVDLTREEAAKSLWVEDVDGNQIKTDDGYNRMRAQMELYISKLEEGRVINTTKGGAKINGTKFKELKEIITNDLNQTVVFDDWLAVDEVGHNKELLQSKVQSMDIALEESYRWIKDCNANLYKMFDLVKNRNFKQLDLMYNKLDISIRALEANDFFTTFILQINRVQHKLLANAIKIFKEEKDLYKKHLDLLNAYKGFIDKCSQETERIKPLYEEMKNCIVL